MPYISGITIHAKRLAIALSARGHDVTIVTSQLSSDLPMVEDEKNDNLKVDRVPVLIKFHKGFIMPLFIPRVLRLIKGSDVVVSHLPQAESVLVSIVSRLFRKKYFVIYHCEVQLPKGLVNKFIEIVLHLLHLITLINADKIITYTKDYANHALLLPYFSKKVISIYPPIPNQKQEKVIKIVQKQSHFVIGVAARLAAEKGLEYLFAAIPYLIKAIGDDFIIRIAGPIKPAGEEKYWKSIQPLLEKYKRFIVFSGTIPPEDMGSFFKQLDVLVLPSVNKTEAFGMVQVEAMKNGIPVVVSDLPGVREPVLVTGMGEIVAPKDVHDLANKIALVLHNKSIYSKNLSAITKIFSYKKSIDQYEKVFVSIS